MTTVTTPRSATVPDVAVTALALLLGLSATVSATLGLTVSDGPGRYDARTLRGAEVTLHGEGLYRWDTWLVGAGSRGQDLVVLLVEVPALLLVLLAWWRYPGPVVPVVLAGQLAFFCYLGVSLAAGNAQNRAFASYVATAALSGFALVRLARLIDPAAVVRALPRVPGRRALVAYLGLVALALCAAWLPEVVAGALGRDPAALVGPYTSQLTHALDLGVVVPVVVLAAVGVARGAAGGRVLATVVLVLNVCIGLLLLGQGVAQVLDGVPLTAQDLVVRMLTFAVLTLVAGGLLLRALLAARPTRSAGRNQS
jgi:hypothetical protein